MHAHKWLIHGASFIYFSGKDRRQVKRDDKDFRDDVSEDSAIYDDLRPSKEFLHRADVADALQNLNASALLTATVMSDYVDPDDDEKLKALFVRHMSVRPFFFI